MNNSNRIQRREYPRCKIIATALVCSRDLDLGSFLVDNLSAGGAHLIGDLPLGVGEELTLLLQLPERDPVSLDAVVRHQGQASGEPVVGVAFERVPAFECRILEKYVTAALGRSAQLLDELDD